MINEMFCNPPELSLWSLAVFSNTKWSDYDDLIVSFFHYLNRSQPNSVPYQQKCVWWSMLVHLLNIITPICWYTFQIQAIGNWKWITVNSSHGQLITGK